MTLYCVTSNGLSFAFGHFLTAYSVKSSLQLTQQEGARLTSIYYGSQVGAWSANDLTFFNQF